MDFYSGFVYKMLGIPYELYTPLFAIARIVGWSAHRLEELANNGKIIRPGGNDTMEVGDSVVIVTTHSGLKSLNEIIRR